MKKIEKDMCRHIWRAIDGNGADYEWHKANTRVYVVPFSREVESDRFYVMVELHGNRIARILCTVGDIARRVEVNDARWATVTTRSRINAICREFGRGRVYQERLSQYYRSTSGNVFPFPSGDWFHAF